MPVYRRARTVEAAVEALAAGHRALAGGTTFNADPAVLPPAVDISGIAALHGLVADDAGWRIGALVTWTEFLEAEPPAAYGALVEAGRAFRGWALRNRGTLGGGLGAGPEHPDTLVAAAALGAVLELAGPDGIATRGIDDEIAARRAGAPPFGGRLLTALRLPPPAGLSSGFACLRRPGHDGCSEAAVALAGFPGGKRRLAVAGADGTVGDRAPDGFARVLLLRLEARLEASS